MKQAKKALRYVALFAILALYFFVAPFGYGAFALLSLLPVRDPEHAARRARTLQGIMRRAFGLLHDLLRWAHLLDFDFRSQLGELPPGPVVLVANHPGFLDVTALMSAMRDITTAVKPILYRRRWWRPLLDGAGLFEGAQDPLDTGHVVEAASARLQQGFRVLIFPEGTRSPQRGLHRFGRTAFEVACRVNVPVVPLLMDYKPVWLGKNQGILALPDQTPRLRVTALPAVWPADCGFSSRKLRDVVEAHLREQLGSPEVQIAGQRHGNGIAKSIPRISTEEADRGSADSGGRQARGHRDGSPAVRRGSGAGLH